jgi:vacuolar-type H+-ATPase subunit I/STV1
MLPTPEKQEIDHRTLKLLVGVIAISLPLLTDFFANSKITSISASYYEGGWSQSIFVGFLFAIAAFLLAYNGLSRLEMLCSKFAAIGALGVALFPCGCDQRVVDIPYVHAVSAAVMFLVLAYFCYTFYNRARAKGYSEANRRAFIYSLCGMAIFASISLLAIDAFTGQKLSAKLPRFIFYGETVSLVAFGVSWLIASRVLPFFSRADERFSPLQPTRE